MANVGGKKGIKCFGGREISIDIARVPKLRFYL
jgi:hypothetical protein